MSSDFVDEYYVEAMIRDAWIALRAEINNEINNAIAELREAIGAERTDRQDADESLRRVIDSRTEHLA